ncbi:hypothetical protein MKX01_005056 [Papaver californicum]|nr:hypothetical protein MKX01_005056 [Papaver californicum]
MSESIQLPVLDISKPISSSSFTSLCQACQEWGFFHITNHGISKDLYSIIYSLSTQLFNLPTDFKLNLGPSTTVETYTPHFIASPYFESFRVSGPDFFASAKSSTDVLFNPPSSEFSEIIEEYGNKMTDISKRIMAIVLNCLGDGFVKKYYEPEFSNCHGYLRIINYTPPEVVKEKEEIEGLGMHTDMSCITIVYQDQIGGLQVRSKQGKWMDINPCEDTLVVNIGDLLQAWSNGQLRSSEHRVILKRPVNRLTLAFFWCFEDDKVILAPDEIVGDGKPRLYKPFVCLEYLKFRQSSEIGKFEKVGFTAKDFAGNKILG